MNLFVGSDNNEDVSRRTRLKGKHKAGLMAEPAAGINVQTCKACSQAWP